MCGICGFTGLGDRQILESMATTLLPRGPDEAGYHVEAGLGLAIRRLSIIDVAGGSQPLRNEDGSLVLVYNGEIYNHQELRRGLLERGHQLASHSDGEVIVHLYEEEGPACLRHLNGMFAIALWDTRKQRLFLARDRMGIKPLYYSLHSEGLVFGSELKALLAHPAVPRNLDLVALDQYLTFEYVPAPRSILREVNKLMPAHFLLWQDRQAQLQRYWSVSYRPQQRSEEDWKEGFQSILSTAVRRQMISDVPLGAFLSGGLDSSSLVACMTDLREVQTFSIGFSEKSFDESAHARLVARHLGTVHHEKILSAQDILAAIPEVHRFLDEPLGDASILPTYLLSRFARQHVTVVLSGDGGDELLAGYPTYFAAHLARLLLCLPRPLRTLATALAQRLPTSTTNWSFDYRLKRFLERLDFPPEERNILWVGSFSPAEKQRICGPALQNQPTFEPLGQFERVRTDLDLTHRLLHLDQNFYLVDDLLVKLDRASMAVSLEGRVPLLDHELVEFLAGMPAHLKLRGWRSKWILKQAMAGRLPASILHRPKKGFGIPVAQWLKGPLRDWIDDLLSPAELERDGLFQPQAVRAMLQDHWQGRRDYRKQLWTLASFVSWRRHFLGDIGRR